jgi:hypothetical protein
MAASSFPWQNRQLVAHRIEESCVGVPPADSEEAALGLVREAHTALEAFLAEPSSDKVCVFVLCGPTSPRCSS